MPEARLEIAGDGDHRETLEAEIEQRGLSDRVVMHGHVPEEAKAELYARAWVALTASSAEGWCLTVMEAAACSTPSAALRVGGLPESIVDGETGVLADEPEELAARVAQLIRDPAERERLGTAAEARARTFAWDRTARENLEVLHEQSTAERHSLRRSLAASETAKAVGLAVATMASNVISLAFTIVFARVLGTDGYGSLAALVSTFLILSVPGLALQVAAARETALGRLGHGGRLSATVARWMRELGLALLVLAAVGIALREPLASLIGVEGEPWAAGAVLCTGVAWLGLSIERGVLQGVRAYRAVGLSIIVEATGRLVLGLVLVGVGLGVTGAYLASPLSMITVATVLAVALRRRLGPPEHGVETRRFERLVAGAWAPVLGLTLVAVIQNIDVIIVKHRVGGDGAGAYAAAAVAAKVVIWVGIGLAFYLVPEAARRAQTGLNPRGVLARALIIISLVAAPMLLVYGLFPSVVLKVGFDVDYASADGALVVLGLAMTLLAVASLAVQYMLAIEHYSFMWLLAVVAATEPLLLSNAGKSLVGLATVVLALQCIAAGGMLALSLRTPRAGRRGRAMSATAQTRFEEVRAQAAGVAGWLTDGQARRLWDSAAALPEGATVVEIGSYHGRSTIFLGRAAPAGAEVVAIDPHAGNDRGPQEIHGTSQEGEADNRVFNESLRRAGVAGVVRHVRRPSQDALHAVDGAVDLLFVDGAHRYRPARHDIEHWGARVAPGGTMLVHDAFSSLGVTLALARLLFTSPGWRYVGRTRSLAEYRREPVRGLARLANAGRQAGQLPWFVRNLLAKAALVARLRPVARLLGSPEWPY